MLHYSGIIYVKGRVYAAVSGLCLEWHEPASPACLQRSVTGIDREARCRSTLHRLCWRYYASQGQFFVAESFFDNDHLDRILEFDASFQRINDYRIDFKSPYGIQGLEYLPGIDQFQIHSHGKVFYRINGRFESGSLISGQADFELQDLARLDAKTLVVNHRQAQILERVKLTRCSEVLKQRTRQ